MNQFGLWIQGFRLEWLGRLAMPDTKNCLNCGYVLDGLPYNRCPECARTFDLENPRTYARNNPRGRPFRSGIAYPLIACAGLVALVCVHVTSRSADNISRPGWVSTQRTILSAAQWAEVAVLGVGAILSRRRRYSHLYRVGMWIAGVTLGGYWALYLTILVLWSI